MASEDRPPAGAGPPERYREFLRMVAGAPLRSLPPLGLDPSDAAQRALLKAHQNREQFRGASDAEYLAWLRRVLVHDLRDAARRHAREAGALGVEADLERSALRLEDWIEAGDTSPPARASRAESLLRLAGALAGLPEDQRRAVELRHLVGLAVPQVAARMERTVPAVAGLLRRGLEALRRAVPDLLDGLA